jgi:hypothetical protein
MAKKYRTSCMIIALLLSGAAPALAQTTPSTPQHMPLQKAIGQAKPEIVPSLIVIMRAVPACRAGSSYSTAWRRIRSSSRTGRCERPAIRSRAI